MLPLKGTLLRYMLSSAGPPRIDKTYYVYWVDLTSPPLGVSYCDSAHRGLTLTCRSALTLSRAGEVRVEDAANLEGLSIVKSHWIVCILYLVVMWTTTAFALRACQAVNKVTAVWAGCILISRTRVDGCRPPMNGLTPKVPSD